MMKCGEKLGELIYLERRLEFNVIGRKIRMKTQFLTQDSAQIDPIPHWIKGFLFTNSKIIVRIQESISPYSVN